MYEEIYKVTLEPVLLYNIAQAHRLGGDFDKAVFFYKGYVRAQPQAKNRGEVQKRIAELELAIEAKRRGQERPPNVPATVEPRARPQTATSQPPAASEPATQPRPSVPATTTSEPATATPPPSDVQTQAAQPTTTQTASNADTSSDKPVWKKWWFWTIIGGVVVVGVVVAVAVVATQAPSFGANLPETGPAAHALTASTSTTAAPSTLRLLEVRF
jgi:hypothetical protein